MGYNSNLAFHSSFYCHYIVKIQQVPLFSLAYPAIFVLFSGITTSLPIHILFHFLHVTSDIQIVFTYLLTYFCGNLNDHCTQQLHRTVDTQ